jgi:hypothetical protein
MPSVEPCRGPGIANVARNDGSSGGRRGCLVWMLGAWIWFGLVIALSDAAVNAPNDQTGQLLLGVVILAPVAVSGWALWRRR